MLLISHTAASAIIGQKISNPLLVSALALGSHFLLDMVPHWNYLDRKEKSSHYHENEPFELWKYMQALPDIIGGLSIFLAFLFSFPDQWLNISLAVLLGTLPDFLTFTKYIPGAKTLFRPINKFHFNIQGHIKKHNKKIIGILTQIILFIVLILILFF